MIVADTNRVAYFLISGEFTVDAERIRASDRSWHVPALFRHELLNVFSSHIRFRNMDRDVGVRLFRRGMSMVHVHAGETDPITVFNLSQSGCSSYDAEFVQLARSMGAPLVTADKEVLSAFPDVAFHPAKYRGVGQ